MHASGTVPDGMKGEAATQTQESERPPDGGSY